MKMLLHIFVPQLPLRRLHGRASVIVHQNGIVADYVVVTPPQWKIVGPSHLFRQKRTGVNVGLVVRIGIVPLRDAVIEIVINQIVLNERILQAGEIREPPPTRPFSFITLSSIMKLAPRPSGKLLSPNFSAASFTRPTAHSRVGCSWG